MYELEEFGKVAYVEYLVDIVYGLHVLFKTLQMWISKISSD